MRDVLRSGNLDLSLIVNKKVVEGVDLVQLETAMGSAVSCFSNAKGLRVSRERFAPVKATSDLLLVRSDCYTFDDDFGLRPRYGEAWVPPNISLDVQHYGALRAFERLVPHPLALQDCRSLDVKGPVQFGSNIEVCGHVTIENRTGSLCEIPSGTRLCDETRVVT